MKKAKRRRATSASPLMTSAKPLGKKSSPGQQPINTQSHNGGGPGESNRNHSGHAGPSSVMPSTDNDHNRSTLSKMDKGHGLSVSYHGGMGSAGSSKKYHINGINTADEEYCPRVLQSSPPHFQQTLLASVVDELEKVSRHSLNWDEFFGSSLDLAPSLLDLYDGIIASASKDKESHVENDNGARNDGDKVSIDEDYSDGAVTSNTASVKHPCASSQDARQHRITSGIHKRAGSGGKHQLPSLSVPPDRPVSMAEAEGLAPSSGNRNAKDMSDIAAQHIKQRPLSMSSGPVSSSSPSAPLCRVKRKQTHFRDNKKGNGVDEDMIPEDSSDEMSEVSGARVDRCRGHCSQAKADGLPTASTSPQMPSSLTLVSESRNSVDSGCVLHGDGSLNLTRGTSMGSKEGGERNIKFGINNNVNDNDENFEDNKASCSCYLYDDMSVSSSDTAGSCSLSYRDEVDSSTSSIREGSAPPLPPVSSSSSSSSSLTQFHDKNRAKDGSISGSKDSFSARRSITGLPNSVSEGFINSSSSRRYPPSHNHSPSSLPLGHHYQNYQPLDERLATSPDGTPKYLGLASPANDSGLATDHQVSLTSTPGSRLSGPVASPWSNSSSIVSGMDESQNTGPDSPDSCSTSSNRSGNSSARRSSSFSKSEARKRFFSNYEEHMRQIEQQSNERKDLSMVSTAALETEAVVPSHSSSENDFSVSEFELSESCEIPPQDNDEFQINDNDHKQNHKNFKPLELESGKQKLSLPGTSPQSPVTSASTSANRPPSKRHSPPTSPVFSSTSPTGHRISSSAHASKNAKRREPGSTSGDGKPGGSGYVSYVQRVVAEILESERTYIASLKDIIQGYLEPMEKILGSTDASEDLACLFGNIKEIYRFGCQFLADLELTSLDPVKVAECFVKHNKGFVIYTDYCTNYPRAVEVLTRFMQHPELSELCKERQLALGHGLPLGAYLLRPVQRILKYHLLLQNIVKNCEKENGGSRSERGSTSSNVSTGSVPSSGSSAILEQAFQHMTHMASHINEMKRKHEHAVRIQEIQSQLEDYVGEDLTRLGDLVLESTFRVYGAKASRQVFLFERGLLISKKKEGGMLSCKTFIRCSNLMLVEVIPNEPLSFHTIPFDNPRAQYTLQARNMEQKRRWCQEIKRLILESFKGKIPDNVKSLVMQLGRNHDDDYVTKEALDAVRKNQHTAPEYLEKRRFRRKSGPRLPDFSLLKPQRAKKGANNKKGDNKSLEINKLSPEVGRRAESKSPDSQRKFLTTQAAKKRSQSQTTSLPSTPLCDTPYPELFHHTNQNRQINDDNVLSGFEEISKSPRTAKTSTPEKKVFKKEKGHPASPTSTSGKSSSSLTSLSSHVAAALISSPDSLSSSVLPTSTSETGSETNVDNVSRDSEESGDTVGEAETVENLITKRASSFRKAMRAHPITSADITELVVRCGGAGSLPLSPRPGSSTKFKQNAHERNETSAGNKEGDNGTELLGSSAMKDLLNTSLAGKSELDDSDIEEGESQEIYEYKICGEDLESQITEVSRAISNGNFLSIEEGKPGKISSDIEIHGNKSMASRSASLPLLNDSDDDDNCITSDQSLDLKSSFGAKDTAKSSGQGYDGSSRKYQKQQKCSHSVEDICGEEKGSGRKSHTGQGRMSRRDLQDRAAQLKKTPLSNNREEAKEVNNSDTNHPAKGNEPRNPDINTVKTSNTDTESLSEKKVLLRNKVKGLRLPNTHKHLSVQDYTSISALRNKALADGSKAKLIGWSSADKLTKGSMTDLSHLEEDPWVLKTEVDLADDEQNNISSASAPQKNDAQPRVHSDSFTLDGSRGGSKENLDWLVYLNRNTSSTSISPLLSSSNLAGHSSIGRSAESDDQPISNATQGNAISSTLNQSPDSLTPKTVNEASYATPPRAFMTSGNMQKFDSLSRESLRHDGARKGLTSVEAKVRPGKITLARPVKLKEASNLSRSNSLPLTSCNGNGMSYTSLKSLSKNRHSSIQNFEHLSEQESAQKMIDEMEEYIKAVTEPTGEMGHHRLLPQRFPTSLPAITVEEEDTCEVDIDDDDTRPLGSKRLSVISSVSTSSYESQGSWSSGSDEMLGGLMGTLKHKLQTWANDTYLMEGQERENDASSDGSTINRASALASDEESDGDDIKSRDEHRNMHSKLTSDKNGKSVNDSKGIPKSLPNAGKEILREELQLESVLREHRLGSSSLGLRMAKTEIPPENSVGRELPPSNVQALSPQVHKAHSSSDYLQQYEGEGNTHSDDNFRSDTNVTVSTSGRVSASVFDVSSSVNSDVTGQDKAGNLVKSPSDLTATRFSLPPTKEATEALMPPALRGLGCELQQSDSGFSLQSTASSSNGGSSSSGDLTQSADVSPVMEDIPKKSELVEAAASASPSNRKNIQELDAVDEKNISTDSPKPVIKKSVIKDMNKTSDSGMKRSDSCGSMDSTDSFYERRLSVAFESDVFSNLPSVMKVRHELELGQRPVGAIDGEPTEASATTVPYSTASAATAVMPRQIFPPPHTDTETPISRKSIKEYVQSIEEMFKPQSPKVMEVRRREPGAMIRERLQNLRDQVLYGRRDGSEERGHGYARSKSQPPSQHRSSLLHSSSQSSLSSTTSGCAAEGGGHHARCSDDIFFNDHRGSGSRDSLVSMHNITTQPCTLWGSRESVFYPPALGSSSKEKLNGSKDRLYGSRESLLRDKRSSSIDLMRTGSKEHVTRESILSSPVLARKDLQNKNLFQRLPPQHSHPAHLSTVTAISPTDLDGNNSKHSRDLSARFSMPPACPSHPSQMNNLQRTNQFVHRTRSSSDHSTVSLSERSSSPVLIHPDAGSRGIKVSSSFSNSSPLMDPQQQQLSRSTGRLDQLSTEVDNLVIMKGWVRSLISKFQDQP